MCSIEKKGSGLFDYRVLTPLCFPFMLSKDGTTYQKVAAHYRATYFKIEDWNAVTKGLSRDEIWQINKTFIKQQTAQGKKIIFSHDPLKARPGSFFEEEVDYLDLLEYTFRNKDQWTWEAVKK